MKGYFSGMLAGGLIGAVTAFIVLPYIRPTITSAVERGKEFMDEKLGKMQQGRMQM